MNDDATTADTGFAKVARLRTLMDKTTAKGFGDTETASLTMEACATSLSEKVTSICTHRRKFLDSQRKPVEHAAATLDELKREQRSARRQSRTRIAALTVTHATLWSMLIWRRYWKLLAAGLAAAGIFWLAVRYGPPAYSYVTEKIAEMGTFLSRSEQENVPQNNQTNAPGPGTGSITPDDGDSSTTAPPSSLPASGTDGTGQ